MRLDILYEFPKLTITRKTEIENKGSIRHEKEVYLLDKALRKSIAVMKSTLVNFDDIVNNVNDEWVLKELLMQYRMIIHGDIDTFLKLRKRLMKKVPKEYFSDPKLDETAKVKESLYNNNDHNNSGASKRDASIHVWTTKGIWQ